MQRPARHLAKCFACANCIVALVANRVANFVALDVASHHYRLVANPVLTMLPTVLPTKKLASMVALLACRGGVRTFVAACGWRSSLACLLGALAAAPGSVAMLAHRLIALRAALARWWFRFQAVIEFFGFLCTHHSHVGDVRSA